MPLPSTSELKQFRRSVDHLFDSYNGYPAERQQGGASERADWSFSPAIETAWDEHTLRPRAIVPGARQDDVNVALQVNQVVISGERTAPEQLTKNAFTHLTFGNSRPASRCRTASTSRK